MINTGETVLVNKLVYANQITWLFKRRGFYINIFEVIRLTGKKKTPSNSQSI